MSRAPREGDAEPADPIVDEVRRKAVRRARAARSQHSPWAHLRSVGILGWVFVLPVVAFTLLGKLAAEALHRPGLTLFGLALGLAVGGASAYRNIKQGLERDPNEEEGG